MDVSLLLFFSNEVFMILNGVGGWVEKIIPVAHRC